MEKLKLVIAITLLLLLYGCSNDDNYVQLNRYSSSDEKVESLWELQLADEVVDYSITDNRAILLLKNNTVAILDIQKGKILAEIDYGLDQNEHSIGFSANEKYAAINFRQKIVILDLINKKVLQTNVETELPIVAIGSLELYEDYFIYWSYVDEKLICKKITDNTVAWELGGSREEHGVISIFSIDAMYFITMNKASFDQINPASGNIIKSFQYAKGTKLVNEDFSANEYDFITEIEDANLEFELKKRMIGAFLFSGSGKIYSKSDLVLTVLDQENEVDWKTKFENTIRTSSSVNDYVILSLKNEGIKIISLADKVVVFEEKFEIGGRSFIIEYENSFILSDITGVIKRLKVY